MDLNDLITIIRQGEGVSVEFKVTFPSQAREAAQVLCSFANTNGGTVLVGVNDDGKLEGVEDADEVMQRLAGAAQSICRPPVPLEMDRLDIGNNRSVVWARVGSDYLRLRMVEGRCYIRVGSTSVPVTDGEYLETLLRRSETRPRSTNHLVAVTPISPPTPKSFKGRNSELGLLTEHLRSDRISIILLAGISGIGKTALAASFAGILDKFDYSPLWIDCVAETTFDSITLELARFARAQGDTGLAAVAEEQVTNLDEQIGRISSELAGRRYALFLDDYHLISDPMVQRFLVGVEERGKLTKVVLTARTRPQSGFVSAAGVAEIHIQSGLDALSCRDLLRDCGVDVDDSAAKEVWRISGGGHPKALHILASRAQRIPIHLLLTLLPVFREEMKQHWLVPLLDELSATERRVVMDLSIFDRPIPIAALSILYSDSNIFDTIVSLVDRFILDYVPDSSLGMHMLIREFCSTLVQDIDCKHHWAASMYLNLLEAVGEPEDYSDVELDYGLAAWSHLIKAGDHQAANSIVRMLRSPLMNRGNYDQLMMLLETTDSCDDVDRQWSLIDKSRILSIWGNKEEAVKNLKPLIDSLDEPLRREAILVLANIYVEQGLSDEAMGLLEAHRPLFERSNLTRVTVRYLNRYVEACLAKGESNRAYEMSRLIFEASEVEENKISGGIALRQMSVSYLSQGNLSDAHICVQLSCDLLSEQGRVREAALSKLQLIATLEEMKEYSKAKDELQDALEAFLTMGDRRSMRHCRERLIELSKVA